MEPFRFRQGAGPLVVSIPHAGTFLPADLAARMTPAALAVPDTDWHVDRLYAGLLPGATTGARRLPPLPDRREPRPRRRQLSTPAGTPPASCR